MSVGSALPITEPIKVKFSGDGARFSKSSNIFLLSFSLPGLQANVLSGAGEPLLPISCESIT